jgi:carboxypeptidase PM20D1
MKKILSFLLWLITVLLIIIIIKTLLFKSLQVKPEPVNLIALGNESCLHLSEAVTYPTISYSIDSPIDTLSFERYLGFIGRAYPLVNEKLDKEIFSRFSVLYRWKGSNASLKPLILMAHYDVVPPGDTSLWEYNPFSGADNDGFIWGRGTLDDKASMISILEAVERLLVEGFEPERTIYLSFGHDEEIGGSRGAKVIAAALRDRGITPEYVLDEGMTITRGMVPMIKKPVALIGITEKGYLSLKLSINMEGGHSSIPGKESAIILLNNAVSNLVNKQMKPQISEPLDDFIRYLGPEMPFYARVLFANKWIFKGLLLTIYKGSPSGNALIRTTTAPTIFKAGIKDNVIPASAEAVVNFRILPGETSDEIINHVAKVIGDKRIKIEIYDSLVNEPAPVSPVDGQDFNIVTETIRQVFPEAVTVPTMMLGASDSYHFSENTENIYRFAPLQLTTGDMERIHGLNERNGKDEFKKGIGFYYQLIKNSQSNYSSVESM